MSVNKLFTRIDNLHEQYINNITIQDEAKELAKDIHIYISRDVNQICNLYINGYNVFAVDSENNKRSILVRKVLQSVKISITNQLFYLFEINPTITTIKNVMVKLFGSSINHDILLKSFDINKDNTSKNKISKSNLDKLFGMFNDKTDSSINYLLIEMQILWNNSCESLKKENKNSIKS